jgi:hypothetical protein
MRKIVFAVILLLTLLTALQIVEVAIANPLPPAWMNPNMTITIKSPANGTEQTLPLLVNFAAEGSREFVLSSNQTQDWNRAFFYTIDDENMTYSGHRFPEIQGPTGETTIATDHSFSGQTIVSNLPDGSHRVVVYWGVDVNVGTPYEQIVYNSSWSASSQVYINSQQTPNPTNSTMQPLFGVDIPPLLLPIAVTTIIIVIIVGTLLYLRRRRK